MAAARAQAESERRRQRDLADLDRRIRLSSLQPGNVNVRVRKARNDSETMDYIYDEPAFL
jgi:hypothetical protein